MKTTHRTTSSSVRPGALRDPLSGGAVSRNPVLAVKIDNTFFEVPQFGVSAADVVFVEQVEGGLTRLIAVFHSNVDVEVGPVRSVRTTDSQLLPAFGAKPVLVFSGGHEGTMAALYSSGIIDGSIYEDAYFRSDAAYGTYNLHAQLAKIAAEATDASPARSIGFTFAPTDPRVAAGAPVRSIDVVMEAARTDFSYSAGHFVRMRDGAPVLDYQGGEQIADNVLVQRVTDEPDGFVDTNGSPSQLSKTVGSGEVTLYRDGRAIPGTWKRAGHDSPFVYSDAQGRPLPFKPGHTWIVLAPQTAQIATT